MYEYIKCNEYVKCNKIKVLNQSNKKDINQLKKRYSNMRNFWVLLWNQDISLNPLKVSLILGFLKV